MMRHETKEKENYLLVSRLRYSFTLKQKKLKKKKKKKKDYDASASNQIATVMAAEEVILPLKSETRKRELLSYLVPIMILSTCAQSCVAFVIGAANFA